MSNILILFYPQIAFCVRYSNMSLVHLTLSKNEKVEQHIRKKIHKLNILKVLD